MTYRHIALMGRARSGKDTVARRLVSTWAFTRVAFADPLKDMALNLDPVVMYEPAGYGPLPVRLTDVVKRWGWGKAKDRCPEVRRTLQRLGESVRAQDDVYWLSLALDKVAVADRWNLPVVVTDVRYENEAQALKSRGFTLVRLVRPQGAERMDESTAGHESETALDHYPADVSLANNGTLNELSCWTDALVQYR
ncbi:hypothetical protein AB0M39_33435 [Streptomyces sp. NPDC051907]|uniref:deoxynucleotide monophosphate kinase family protein n=1 Tax=Streptomyces sp. NPDC051907 TaxID=3155284 RepID=UPI00341D5898